MISLVDLGVVKSVEVEASTSGSSSRRRSWAAPRSTRCARQMEEAVTALGGEPQVDVLLDDSWSTDKITPAGREKLREAGFAPPTPRGRRPAGAAAAADGGPPLPLLQLDGDAAREHLRPHPVPLAPLLRELQAAVRAVQDDLEVSPPAAGSVRRNGRAGSAVALAPWAAPSLPTAVGLAARSEWDTQLVLRPGAGHRLAEGVNGLDGERRPLSRSADRGSSQRNPLSATTAGDRRLRRHLRIRRGKARPIQLRLDRAKRYPCCDGTYVAGGEYGLEGRDPQPPIRSSCVSTSARLQRARCAHRHNARSTI